MDIRQGEIYLADLSPGYKLNTMLINSSQDVRIVLVVQNDIGNKYAPTVIVASVTTRINEPKLPTHVKVDYENDSGIGECGIALLEQIRTIDKARLIKKLSTIGQNTLEKVKDAWLISGGVFNQQIDEKESKVKKYYRYVKGKFLDEIVEDIEYEFKAPQDPNRPKNIINKEVGEYIVAYLNSDGGRILFGIKDNGEVEGMKIPSKLMDEIKKIINMKIRNISPPISPEHIGVNFHKVYDKDEVINEWYILEVIVNRRYDQTTIYLENGKNLYVKGDGVRNKLLNPHEMLSFAKKRGFDEAIKNR